MNETEGCLFGPQLTVAEMGWLPGALEPPCSHACLLECDSVSLGGVELTRTLGTVSPGLAGVIEQERPFGEENKSLTWYKWGK